jgi:HK97 family phage major capsid protein
MADEIITPTPGAPAQFLDMKQLREVIWSTIDKFTTEKGYFTVGEAKDRIIDICEKNVAPAIRKDFEAELKKLNFLPGPGGSADIGKGGDSTLKGLRKDGGWKGITHYAADIALAAKSQNQRVSGVLAKWRDDQRLYEESLKAAGDPSLNSSDPEYGGDLIPPEFNMKLLEKGLELSNFFDRATPVPMARNQVNMPFLQDFDHSSGLTFGGMQSYWTDELGTKVPSAPKFGHVTLKLHKLILLLYSSDELLEDSAISMEPLFTRIAPQVLAWRLDREMLFGSGGAMPIGAVSAANPALITQDKDSGQAASTITYSNVVNMVSRMRPTELADAVWVANIGTFPQLAFMHIPIGTAGAAVYLPAGGASGKPYSTLMGLPMIYSEHCPALGTLGDFNLISWPSYLVGRKAGAGNGISYATSIHLMFLYDQSAFRWVFRCDGQPWWPKVFTPEKGSTQSPFVTLQART